MSHSRQFKMLDYFLPSWTRLQSKVWKNFHAYVGKVGWGYNSLDAKLSIFSSDAGMVMAWITIDKPVAWLKSNWIYKGPEFLTAKLV